MPTTGSSSGCAAGANMRRMIVAPNGRGAGRDHRHGRAGQASRKDPTTGGVMRYSPAGRLTRCTALPDICELLHTFGNSRARRRRARA